MRSHIFITVKMPLFWYVKDLGTHKTIFSEVDPLIFHYWSKLLIVGPNKRLFDDARKNLECCSMFSPFKSKMKSSTTIVTMFWSSDNATLMRMNSLLFLFSDGLSLTFCL